MQVTKPVLNTKKSNIYGKGRILKRQFLDKYIQDKLLSYKGLSNEKLFKYFYKNVQ